MGQRDNIAKKSDRRINRASSDARPELAGRESHRGDGKPAGPDRPLGKGVGGIKKERAERQGLGQQRHNIAK